MRTIPPEEDYRTLTPIDWAEIRMLLTKIRGNTLNYGKERPQITDAFERLFGECRRLRSISEQNYLIGFNDCMKEKEDLATVKEQFPGLYSRSFQWC